MGQSIDTILPKFQSEVIAPCYEIRADGWKYCLLKDAKGKPCKQKYAASTKSTNMGIHIKKDHEHCKEIIDKLTAIEKNQNDKKRARDNDKVVELPSKTVKLNHQSFQSPNSTVEQTSTSDPSKITAHLQSDSSSLRKELCEAIALWLNVESLPASLIESPYFHTVLDAYVKCIKAGTAKPLSCGRRVVTASEIELVKTIQQTVTESLQTSAYPLTLAFDGWQNTNHLHVQNIIAQSSNASVFLKSDLSKDRATAENLFAFIAPVIDDLIQKKIEVGGIVSDNASVNGKINKLISERYPWILTIPCASHTLQLCIVRLFERDAIAEGVKSVVRDAVKAVTHSNVRLCEFLRVQGDDATYLVKPQKTRWNSYHRACSSVLKHRFPVQLALGRLGKDAEHPVLARMTPVFWDHLEKLVAFLDPFAYASNVIQSDQASLLDVHIQFSSLLQHVQSPPLCLSHGASVMKDAILHHWNTHVKQEAVYMVARFAHETIDRKLFCDRIIAGASTWFYEWAAQLWIHHQSLNSSQPLTAQEHASELALTKQKIQLQYSQFLRNEFPYNRIRTQIETNRPTESRHSKLFTPFDAFTPWLAMGDVVEGEELIHAVITLLSLNCSEASVERSFSQQKLTHSLLMNRKLPSTVERQMYIKSNHRVMRQKNRSSRVSMRSSSHLDDAEEAKSDDEDFVYESETDIELFDSDISSDDDQADDENEEENEEVSQSSSIAANEADNAAVSAQARSNARRVERPVFAPLVAARRTYTIVPHLTLALDLFCKAHIAANELALPDPFARRGASKLRKAMESDETVRLEQPSDAQRHIFFLLDEAAAAAAEPTMIQDRTD